MLSPIQKFRWVHFPLNAEMEGLFEYKATPVFMNKFDELSYGIKTILRRIKTTTLIRVSFIKISIEQSMLILATI